MRNIEIKAKVGDMVRLIEKAKKLAGSEGTLIKQHDTFYNAPNGRLKLRRMEQGAEIIYYHRPDVEGPKLSSYEKSAVASENVESLHRVLDKALGSKVHVKKTRYLYIVGQTRVHIDHVEGLGDFMELECMLNDDQSLDDGQKIVQNIMNSLGIAESDLLSGAYADMLQNPVQ
ncbi:adenylate cyclase CyaB [Cylas formicarius]|uniref:adenylate cyclase CyaB n=1 Tax=Cylas formicarius TaxID=197179 RepID=UPI0029589E47|nr:adenylate cyclase CyaB [Cylas formicarius]